MKKPYGGIAVTAFVLMISCASQPEATTSPAVPSAVAGQGHSEPRREFDARVAESLRELEEERRRQEELDRRFPMLRPGFSDLRRTPSGIDKAPWREEKWKTYQARQRAKEQRRMQRKERETPPPRAHTGG